MNGPVLDPLTQEENTMEALGMIETRAWLR